MWSYIFVIRLMDLWTCTFLLRSSSIGDAEILPQFLLPHWSYATHYIFVMHRLCHTFIFRSVAGWTHSHRYLEDNYLRGRRRGRGRQRPQFPPETWNCYERTLENLPRTNTFDAWHRRINTLIGKHHPSFFHAIEQSQAEVSEINRDIERLEAGHSPQRKRRKYIATDSRILRIVENYQTYKVNDNILGYLRAIGHNVAGTL